MPQGLKFFAQRSRYRPASVALLGATSLALSSMLIGVPDWLSFVSATVAAVVLIIITYHRLRDGAFSGGWVLLMIFAFSIGPTWRLSDHLTFNLGGAILGCIPVILGWIIPANFGANPRDEVVPAS